MAYQCFNILPFDNFQDYVGSIETVYQKEQVFKDIILGKPVQYRTNFPLSSPIPTVSKIVVNGRTVCETNVATPERMYTKINLEHTLYTIQEQKRLDYVDTNPIRNIDIDDRGENTLEIIYARPTRKGRQFHFYDSDVIFL
jgi:hypothetical protein